MFTDYKDAPHIVDKTTPENLNMMGAVSGIHYGLTRTTVEGRYEDLTKSAAETAATTLSTAGWVDSAYVSTTATAERMNDANVYRVRYTTVTSPLYWTRIEPPA